MEEEIEFFDGDNASLSSHHHVTSSFSKYRAVEVYASELHSFSLLQSAPAHKNGELFIDDRKLYTRIVDPVPKAVSSPTVPTITVKCPEKPTRVASNTSFYTKEMLFENIKGCVEQVFVSELKEYDWCFLDDDCMWKCKFFQGSNLREFDINCYWDSFCEDHIIEVKKMKGDGIPSSDSSSAKSNNKSLTAVDIVQMLQAKILPSQEGKTLPSSVKKGGKLRGPLPLPMPSINGKPMQQQQSKELFLQGIEPILKMAKSYNMEARLESAKMLCDLIESDKSLLSCNECQDLCFEVLETLIYGENSNNNNYHENEHGCDDVKQYAMMAFGMFAELDCYQECFLHFKNFDEIIRLIQNECPSSASKKPSCLCIQMRRQAAKGLSLLVKRAISSTNSQRIVLQKQLQCFGFHDEQQWKHHCETLCDDKLKNYALEIGLCY